MFKQTKQTNKSTWNFLNNIQPKVLGICLQLVDQDQTTNTKYFFFFCNFFAIFFCNCFFCLDHNTSKQYQKKNVSPKQKNKQTNKQNKQTNKQTKVINNNHQNNHPSNQQQQSSSK